MPKNLAYFIWTWDHEVRVLVFMKMGGAAEMSTKHFVNTPFYKVNKCSITNEANKKKV
jgi:hypothetical protein